MAGLRDAMGRADLERESLGRRVAEERARLAESEAREVQALKEDLGATRAQIAALETERAVGERIIRPTETACASSRARTASRTRRDGRCVMRPRGKTANPPARRPRTGRASRTPSTITARASSSRRGGIVLTNRHVAEPWWNDAAAQAFQRQGFQPRFRPPARVLPQPGRGLCDDRGHASPTTPTSPS